MSTSIMSDHIGCQDVSHGGWWFHFRSVNMFTLIVLYLCLCGR